MLTYDLGEVLLEGIVFSHIEGFAAGAKVGEAAATGILKVREGCVRYTGDPESRCPIWAEALRSTPIETSIEAKAHFIDGCGVKSVGVGQDDVPLIEGTDVDIAVDNFSEFAHGAFFAAMAHLGIAAKETMIDVELVVYLKVVTLKVIPATGIVGEVVDQAGGLDGYLHRRRHARV